MNNYKLINLVKIMNKPGFFPEILVFSYLIPQCTYHLKLESYVLSISWRCVFFLQLGQVTKSPHQSAHSPTPLSNVRTHCGPRIKKFAHPWLNNCGLEMSLTLIHRKKLFWQATVIRGRWVKYLYIKIILIPRRRTKTMKRLWVGHRNWKTAASYRWRLAPNS